MSRSHHGGQRSLTVFAISRGLGGERPDAPPLGKSQRRGKRFPVRMLARGSAIRLLHPSSAEFIEQSPLAVAATRQRLGLGQRIGGIIDIALVGETSGNGVDVRLAIALPPALPKLAIKV